MTISRSEGGQTQNSVSNLMNLSHLLRARDTWKAVGYVGYSLKIQKKVMQIIAGRYMSYEMLKRVKNLPS